MVLASSDYGPSRSTLYTYKPLATDHDEIRLVDLLPGNDDDRVRLIIHHQPLRERNSTLQQKRRGLECLQKTLHPPWKAFENPEGRYFFSPNWDPNKITRFPLIQYEHPDVEVDPELYEPDHSCSEFGPKYEALSYVWGSSTDTHPVEVLPILDELRGESFSPSASILPIRSNLISTLKHLRLRDRHRTLWIDAICIDQTNDVERAEQVSRMHRIYTQATAVILWLGPAENDSTGAILLLQSLGEQVELSKEDDWIFIRPGASEPSLYDTNYDLKFDDDQWEKIRQLITRPYFGRLWIMQEALLAGRRGSLHCGQDSLSLPLFRRAVEVLVWRDTTPHTIATSLHTARELTQYEKRVPFAQFISRAQARKCAQPHDKIYGVLSLIPKALASGISPSYSLSAVEVFKDFLLQHLEFTKRLELLQTCSLANSKNAPSWVPVLSETPLTYVMPSHGENASGISRAFAKYTKPDRLLVIGVIPTIVKTVSMPLPSERESLLHALSNCQPANLADTRYINGENAFDAYLITLFLGVFGERFPKLNVRTISSAREKFLDGSFPVHNMLRRLTNASFMTTHDGYFGFVPSSTQPDDSIAVVLGCSNPLVLRPRISGGHIVVGHCYIYGLMDAEALLGPVPKPWIIQSFITNGFPEPKYFNTAKEIYTEDPRLGNLSADWERLPDIDIPDDRLRCAFFKNVKTGQIINSDPRLFPEALSKRGIHIKNLHLY